MAVTQPLILRTGCRDIKIISTCHNTIRHCHHSSVGDHRIDNRNKYMYVCMRVCMYVWGYACMYEGMYVCMRVCMYVWGYVCMYEGMYVCMRVCMYVCVHVCMYVTLARIMGQGLRMCFAWYKLHQMKRSDLMIQLANNR